MRSKIKRNYYRLPSHQRPLYISPIFPRFDKSCRIFSIEIIHLENYYKKTYPSSELFRRAFLVLMNLSITNPLLEKSFNDISASWKYVWWNLTVLINVSTTILCLQNLLKDVTPRLDKYSDVLTYLSKITTRTDESFYDNSSS